MSEKSEQRQEEQTREERRKRERTRLIPIWLRLVIVVVLVIISTTAGAMIGYGVLGDGKPLDALKPSTWQYIIDIVEKDGN
jgi:uncharacterized protein YhaN